MQTSLYLDRGTWIHRLHPAVKLFGLFIMFWSIFWVDHPLALLPVVIVMVLLTQASRSWPNFYAFRWFLILMIPPTMLEWMAVYHAGAPVINLWVIHLSRQALLFGFGRGLRLALLLSTSILFLSTTTIEEFTTSLVTFRLPHRVAFAMSLAFRLVPLFMDSALTVVQAQSLRGYDFKEGNLLERMKRYVPAVIPVFMGALRRANNMAMALEARGFGLAITPTSFIEYRIEWPDIIASIALTAIGIGYFTIYYTGYGAIRAG
jgi:energy-coupling factor transport system permease protein